MLATNAFFSDTETSTGNTFTAGSVDLKVDSTAHYAGLVCTNVNTVDVPNYMWTLENQSVPTTRPDLFQKPCNGTWLATNLGTSNKFFDYTDIKPGDMGENTISLDVKDNDAWMCAKVQTTSVKNMLPKYLTFAWWADNGNNIYDGNESLLFGGPVTLAQMLASPQSFGGAINFTLADNRPLNIFGDIGPIPGAQTRYLSVAWCFGTMTPNKGVGNGFTCSGVGDQNDAQLDNVTGTLIFDAIQSRNNAGFLCPESALLYPDQH